MGVLKIELGKTKLSVGNGSRKECRAKGVAHVTAGFEERTTKNVRKS